MVALAEHLDELGYDTDGGAVSLALEALRNASIACGGDAEPRVTLTVSEAGESQCAGGGALCSFTVADSGAGISQEAAPQLFGLVGVRQFADTEGIGIKLGLMWLHRSESALCVTATDPASGHRYRMEFTWDAASGCGTVQGCSRVTGGGETEVQWTAHVRSYDVIRTLRDVCEQMAAVQPRMVVEFRADTLTFGCFNYSSVPGDRAHRAEASGDGSAEGGGVRCRVRALLNPDGFDPNVDAQELIASQTAGTRRRKRAATDSSATVTVLRASQGVPVPFEARNCGVSEAVLQLPFDSYGLGLLLRPAGEGASQTEARGRAPCCVARGGLLHIPVTARGVGVRSVVLLVDVHPLSAPLPWQSPAKRSFGGGDVDSDAAFVSAVRQAASAAMRELSGGCDGSQSSAVMLTGSDARRREAEDRWLPAIAQSLASIVECSPNQPFRESCLQMLGVDQDADPAELIERKLMDLFNARTRGGGSTVRRRLEENTQ
eukprot:TRINITY_DN20224_c2_g1_i2.p1 TRINITY_DN20224_c2_g1~~TRINITY_DN20224_c2_g1_i2.p1  ORF type:complete len:490 (+),score=128.22 TRINITY_DN20224_c2_g1_i2:43-1512(+)